MASTLTHANEGAFATFYPLAVLGYDASRESQNIIHELLGGGIAVSHRAALPRKGTLAFLFDNEQLADDCLNKHAAIGIWSISNAERPTTAMAYVTSGRLGIELDAESSQAWTVLVDYQEVLP